MTPRPELEAVRAAPPVMPAHTLAIGTRLREYEIKGLIGEGACSIVYLGWDHALQRKVAVKEYMPAAMVGRIQGSTNVVVAADRHLEAVRAGLRGFINEARLLARFDHPSLVKVYRFWEENGTAYMVMPYYEGPTLKAALAELGRAPSEDELRAWLKPLLDALAVMHAAQCYHRDISPDNILLTPRGPLLLDFGAARRVIGDMTHAITVVLKPGYAPIEQYGDVATMAQGAWTDLYALACVVYYAIAGKTPVSSVERLMDDRVEPLAVFAAGRYSDAFLRAIDAALAVRPGDRPQTEREFRALLDAGLPTPPADEAQDSGRVPYATIPGTLAPTPAARPASPRDPAPWQAAPTAAQPPRSIEPTSPAIAGPSRNSAATLLVGGAVIAMVATVSLFAWLQQRSPAPVNASAAASAAVPAASLASPSLPPPAPFAASSLPAPVPSVASSLPAAAPFAASSRPAITAADSLPAAAAKIDRPADAAPVPPTPRPIEPAAIERAAIERAAGERAAGERATGDGEAASGVAAAPTRPARTRRESLPPAPTRVDDVALPKASPPRPPTVSTQCSDILQKASLEPLTATEAAYLKRECR